MVRRLETRRKRAEQKEYDALVADVTRTDHDAQYRAEFLPTARLQMSQGIHICVSMGVGYAMGMAAGSTTNFLGAATVRNVQSLKGSQHGGMSQCS
jgi:hypothetical protein